MQLTIPTVKNRPDDVAELSAFLHDSWVEPPLIGTFDGTSFRLPIQRLGFEKAERKLLRTVYPHVSSSIGLSPVRSVSGLVPPTPQEPVVLLSLKLDRTADLITFFFSSQHFSVHLKEDSHLIFRDEESPTSRRTIDFFRPSTDLEWAAGFVRKHSP